MTANDKMTPGQRLRYLREARGWTQAELEYRSRVTRTQISAIESGRVPNPKRDTMERLAASFEVSRLYLEEGIDLPADTSAGIQTPVWTRGLPDLPAEHVEYIRNLVFQLAREEGEKEA